MLLLLMMIVMVIMTTAAIFLLIAMMQIHVNIQSPTTTLIVLDAGVSAYSCSCYYANA